MKIYFVDPEPTERAYYAQALAGHEAHFLGAGDAVPDDAELVSIFIDFTVDSPFLDDHPKLRLIAARSTTLDHIDLQSCAERGVTVCYVPTYGDHTVAEHAFAMLLAIARRLREANAIARNSFSYEALRGFELRGKILGVIGAGRIGMCVLKFADAFGMRGLAFDIAPDARREAEAHFRYVALPELLQQSDVISLHAPLTRDTYHLLNREAFVQCKRGVTVINTARGALIDTEALIEALDAGIVGAAGLDVLEDERVMRRQCSHIVSNQIIDRLHDRFRPAEARTTNPERVKDLASLIHNEALLSRPNVMFTPHIAFNSIEAVDCINRTTVRNIDAFLRGEPVNVAGKPDAQVHATASR